MKCNFVFLISGAHIPAQPPLSDFLLQLEDYTPTIPGIVIFFFREIKNCLLIYYISFSFPRCCG